MKILGSFFKIPKHKTFQFTYRHYDETKEFIKQREDIVRKRLEEQARGEQDPTTQEAEQYSREVTRQRLSEAFRHRHHQSRKAQGQSMFIRALVIASLCLAIYLVFMR